MFSSFSTKILNVICVSLKKFSFLLREMKCGSYEDSTSECQEYITTANLNLKFNEKAPEWYHSMPLHTGISYENATLEDWQKFTYCSLKTKTDLYFLNIKEPNCETLLPPCTCSFPPCHTCGSLLSNY